MDLKIKSLILNNFKGVKEKKYDFGNKTKISGMNRLGKTTIATAWYWLMSDKDYDLHSNPNIRPDDVEECIPTVTAVLDVDGKEVTVSKMQKRTVSKPNDKGISKVTLTNSYEINSVPKNERDFKAYLEDLGLSFEKFLVCSHPDVFTNQKTADMRKVLFSMVSEKSDYDIAAMWPETNDVAKLLADYTFEEIESMNKASKKKAADQVDAIPNQIIGLERAKVDIDVAELELEKSDMERKITSIDNKISNSSSVLDKLMSESLELQFEINGIYTQANDEITKELRKLDDEEYLINRRIEGIKRDITLKEKELNNNIIEIEAAENRRSQLGIEYRQEAAKVFDESKYIFDESEWVSDGYSTVCSLCGQGLPEEKVSQLRLEFEERKEAAREALQKTMENNRRRFEESKKLSMDSIKNEGFKCSDIVVDLTNKNNSIQDEIREFKHKSNQLEVELREIAIKKSSLPKEPDLSENDRYNELKSRYDEIQKEILSQKDSNNISEDLRVERDSYIRILYEVKEKLAQFSNNIRIDEQISELKEKQRDYEQEKADAEKILYQLSLVSKRKNELLVEEINNHFSVVKWKLFDFQKNGEYKECCIPVIDDKRFKESTNTGREIQAKLDICNSFQKFFGMHVPVFLDGAESLNDCYMPEMDCQLITLNVSEDRELKLEVS